MLYLDTPAGVGFSYSDEKSFYQSVNDAITGSLLLIKGVLHDHYMILCNL